MNEQDDTRFTIRDEEAAPDSLYMADAENLRIEKLSTRITLIAVLIPCLLVIVLAVAYLDIKNRVANTQNTGSMTVQNLSKDLESRFSSLSLKQAKLEEQLANNTKALETATASMQVKLKKAMGEFKHITDAKANRSALASLSKKTDASIADLKKDIDDLNATFNKFDEELAGQIALMAESLKKDQGRLAEIEKKAQRMESQAVSKESINLAVGLERLSLQEMVKDKIREVEKKITALNKQVDALKRRVNDRSRQTAPSVAPPPSRPAPTPSDSKKIEEQSIQ
jgi:chromosome segregation ATPase